MARISLAASKVRTRSITLHVALHQPAGLAEWRGKGGTTEQPVGQRQPGMEPEHSLRKDERHSGTRKGRCSAAVEVGIEQYLTKAVYFCWLLHLIGDLHQPLHSSAACFSAKRFREGDLGRERDQRLPTRGNLHGRWDGMLGNDYLLNDIRRRAADCGLKPNPWSQSSQNNGFGSVADGKSQHRKENRLHGCGVGRRRQGGDDSDQALDKVICPRAI